MRTASLHGVYRRRGKHTRPAPAVHDDLVQRRFVADAPNRLWLTDITEHPTREGKVYCAAVLDVYSRRIVGWSLADHLRAGLVVDARDLARWRRRPVAGQTVVHSDRGTQGGFSWSMQHLVVEVVRHGCYQASAGDSCDAWPDVVAGSAVNCAA